MSPAASEPKAAREARRSRVLMTGKLVTPSGVVDIRIRDLSVVGAQIWAPSPVPGNCDAILKRGNFFAAVRVVRSSDRNIGLKFYRELSDEEFASAFQYKIPPAAAAA